MAPPCEDWGPRAYPPARQRQRKRLDLSSMAKTSYVNAVVKSSFFHLRSVAKGKQFLSSKDLEIVIQTLICHSLSPSALCFPAHI